MLKRKINISEPMTGEREWKAVKEPIYSGWLTQGPKVQEFEKRFATLHGASFGLATTSCTTALHLILHALHIGPGDEVIVPAFSWVASANVILYCGAKPVFVDVDPHTYNLSPEQVKAKITDNTKAVMVVHLFGLCADVEAIRNVIPSQVKIIEDAACAAGAKYNGKSAGSLGDAAAFSFHPRKTITTGEGGMVTTNDESLAKEMTKLRNHGAEISEEQRHHGPQPYLLPEFNVLGFNYRMTDLQGAVGLEQLSQLDNFLTERRHWAKYYQDGLSDVPWLSLPSAGLGYEHAWQAFVTKVDESISPFKRNQIMQKLQDKGIATRPGTHAIHMLNYYTKRFNLQAEEFVEAKRCNDLTMAIPLHNKMTEQDFEYVVRAIKELA